MLKIRVSSSKSNLSNLVTFSFLYSSAYFNFPLSFECWRFCDGSKGEWRGFKASFFFISIEYHSSLYAQIGEYCWVRQVALEVAALITEYGFFNKLPKIDLVALQNGIQENCFF